MLIWKTQTLNANIASLRYRCLLPLKYLANKGVAQVIYGGVDSIELTAKTDAIIFVKSFQDRDVTTCRQAAELGVPIILDLCDNIFIPGYATDSSYVPADNFRLMAQQASAIVTTGEALKAEVERALAEPLPGRIAPLNIPITVIPDGCETQLDLADAFRTTQRRWLNAQVGQVVLKRSQAAYRKYRESKRRARNLLVRLKIKIKQNTGNQEVALTSQPSVANLIPIPKAATQAVERCPPSQATRSDEPSGQPSDKSLVQPTPLFPQRWPSAKPGTKTILWFGNHGAKYGSFGMSSILQVASAIEQLSGELPLRLVVVSNSQAKYERYIQPLPFDTVYLRWHPRKIYDYIRASDVVIIPNSQSIFSICKSANRAVLALSQGTPVVANRTPALNRFEDCVILDDWRSGLRQYLLNPEIAQAHTAAAQRAIARNLSGEKIADEWLNLLESVKTHRNHNCTDRSFGSLKISAETPSASAIALNEQERST